ncbi:MAG: hypothetical protein KF796_03660 [Ramlibacter sp.]|nr:hypothetical protein [Ramlibacter sp.]
MTTAAGALAKLRNDPASFLANYFLINERAMHQSGPTQYWLGALGYVNLQGQTVFDRTPRPGSILGTWRMHNSKNFKFARNQGAVVGVTAPAMVWHVDVVGAAAINVAAIPSLQVSRVGGPDIMVTTLLNGCTFACEARVNDVLMAHVQPTGTTAALLEANVIANGALANGGAVGSLTAFGGNLGYNPGASDVTIVGVRTNGAWALYAQIHPRNQRAITQVVNFFNG